MRLLLLAPLLSLLLACRTGDKPADGNVDTGGLDTTDGDGDGYPEGEDCDDDDASINEDATEVCDGIDNDCDGDIDEGVTGTFYEDADGDGHGDEATATEECSQPEGMVANGNDCDDTNEDIHPDARELCDGVDNDCNGVVDDGEIYTWYADTDADGFGDPGSTVEDCAAVEGYVETGDDCDDTLSAVNPDATELCDDIDNDCDGIIDEGDAADASTWYVDADGDSWGDDTTILVACDQPAGTTGEGGDCDDTSFDVNPGATEICNGIDDDCDVLVDDVDPDVDLSTGGTWYGDTDHDGFGDAGSAVQACSQPSGTVTDSSDCNDTSLSVNPDATEVCNSLDDDCDSLVDDDDSSLDLSSTSTFYVDGDGDGHGGSGTVQACLQPGGSTTTSTDCNDANAAVNPDETEICNSIDDDCDALVDDDDSSLDLSSAGTWYVDADLDGYGSPGSGSVQSCAEPSGYTDDASDCDDTDTDVNPAAAEDCNGYDDDCDGVADSSAACPCNLHYYNSDYTHPYLFCDTAAAWTTAESDCRALGYELTSIGSAAENTWLDATADSYSTQKWWMGFTDQASEGNWVWQSGEAVTYTNWHAGEPNNAGSNEDCGQLNRFTDDSWNDEPCSTPFRYICEAP